MIAKLRLLGPAGLTKKCVQHSHSQQFCSRIAVKYLYLMSSMDQSARRNPTDPMMEKAGKARLCSYYCYWSHTVANTQQFAMSPYGDFNASTFCGGLEIGNNCTVMEHLKPRLVVGATS